VKSLQGTYNLDKVQDACVSWEDPFDPVYEALSWYMEMGTTAYMYSLCGVVRIIECDNIRKVWPVIKETRW